MKTLTKVKETSYWFKYGKDEFDIRRFKEITKTKMKFSEPPQLHEVCNFIQSISNFEEVLKIEHELEKADQAVRPRKSEMQFTEEGIPF